MRSHAARLRDGHGVPILRNDLLHLRVARRAALVVLPLLVPVLVVQAFLSRVRARRAAKSSIVLVVHSIGDQ